MSEINHDSDNGVKKKKTNWKQLAVRIGAALLLIVVVIGIFLPMYNPGSPIKRKAKVMTVNDHDVSAEEFEYFLSNDIYDYAFYNGGDYFADSANFAQIRDYVQQEVTFYYSFMDWANESGYGLTQEEKDEVKVHLETLKLQYGTEEEFQKFLDSMYATEEILNKTEEMFAVLDKFYAHLHDPEESPYTESAKSLVKSADTFGIYGAKHILILNDEESRTAEETQALAQSILDRLNAGEDFDKLMKEYSEDPGLETSPDGYTFSEGEFVTEFYDATRQLAVGEHSGLVKSSYGYHIIKRIEPNEEQAVEKLIDFLYEAETDSVVKAAKVSLDKGFDQITYSDFRISKDFPAGAAQNGNAAEGDPSEGGAAEGSTTEDSAEGDSQSSSDGE